MALASPPPRELAILCVGLDPDTDPTTLPGGARSEWRWSFVSFDALDELHGLAKLPSFDALLLDARQAEPDQVHLCVRRILEMVPTARLVVIVDDGRRAAAAAVEAGAWDVLRASEATAPIDERLAAAARMQRLLRSLAKRGDPESEDAAEGEDDTEEMVGTSPALKQVFAGIRRAASSDAPVLITGEPGTGKELAAVAVHQKSARGAGPIITIECSAVPAALLDAELFGSERNPVTGVVRPGRLEAARGGTLFLDEVAVLTPALQEKLLRLLDEQMVERAGARQGVPLDVRVLAATSRDLPALVEGGGFRRDLYERLAALTLPIPPLRERGDDVALIARFFLQRFAKSGGRWLRGFSREALDAMHEYRWPGNVRELIGSVRRAVVAAEGTLITPRDLGLKSVPPPPPELLTLRETRRAAELGCLRLALRRAEGNKAEAAKLLGVSRTQLYELLSRHQIPSP